MSGRPEEWREVLIKGVAQRVQTLREAAGLSKRCLARRAGLTPAAVRKIEGGAGDPKLTTLVRLAAVLGVGLCELLPAEPWWEEGWG